MASAPYSLKGRLLVGILTAVTLVWLGAAAYTYFDARKEVNELLDAHLAQSASLLVAQVGHDLEEIDLEHAPSVDRRARRVAFQIWERGRVLRLHSADAPSSRLSQREQGYSNATIEGRRWRVFSTWDARHRILVQIAERDEARREIATGIAANVLLPLLVALPLLAAFAWLVIGGALRPLNRLGREVERRRPDLLEPLAVQGAPREAIPLVRSLNALFERVARLIEGERRFTADAAHELRTPLAALKTQAQVAKGALDDAARQHALDGVIEGCDRATRLVEQLLTLARLEPDAARAVEQCDLVALAEEVIAALAPFALAKDVEIELRGCHPVVVEGHPELLAVLLRNLVDNAVRYGPRGSSVTIEVARARGPATITVDDEGPGVAPEEKAKLGQRFHRGLGTGESGSGLGLSIVRRIVEMHRGSVRFQDAPAKGLRVVVELPLAMALNS